MAPELTDAGKVQLLHFPSGAVRVNSPLGFIIKRNGVKGNFEVRVEGPSGQPIQPVRQQQLDPERFQIDCQLDAGAGLYKVHIKCNSVTLPRSPFIIVAIAGATESIDGKPASSSGRICQKKCTKAVIINWHLVCFSAHLGLGCQPSTEPWPGPHPCQLGGAQRVHRGLRPGG